MKSIATVLILLFINSSVDVLAQLTQRNLFQRFSEDDIRKSLISTGKWHPFPTKAKEWKQYLPDSIIRIYIANGDSSLKQDFSAVSATGFLQFTRSKNSPQADKRYHERRSQLFNLVMAESMEGTGRFNDKIADAVWAICEESSWVIPAHIKGLPNVDEPYVDLFAAETASLLAWTYYFAGDNLNQVSVQLKPRIVSEVKRRMFDPMQTATWWWIGNDDPNKLLNNWSPWIMSNYIAAALILVTDETKKAAAIKKGMNTIDHYLNGLGNDAAINEGPIYWFPSIGCVFDALALLHSASAGKINLYQEPFLQQSASYIYKVHIADRYYVNNGDAEVTMDVDGVTLYRFGKSINDSTLMALGRHAAKNTSSISNKPIDRMFSRRFFNLAEMSACVKHEGRYTMTKNAWMPDIQMLCSRSDNGFFVAAHGGHNAESHNHNDVGDFVVYFNGKPVLLDVGRGTYTPRTFSDERYSLWFNTSTYHNLPEVNGMQQKDGRQFGAKDVQYTNNTKFSSVSMDISGAYPAEAGLENWERTVSLYKKGWVEIKDDYSLKAPSNVRQHFMTVCDADISRPGKIRFTLPDQSKLQLIYDANTWGIEKHPMVLSQPEDEEIRKAWEGQTIMRITLTAKKPVKKAVANYTIKEGS